MFHGDEEPAKIAVNETNTSQLRPSGRRVSGRGEDLWSRATPKTCLVAKKLVSRGCHNEGVKLLLSAITPRLLKKRGPRHLYSNAPGEAALTWSRRLKIAI